MTRLVVTVDWRTAAEGWPGGQLYLVDLESHQILDHHVGSLVPDSIMEPGGWSGFRGAAWDGEVLYVADMWTIRRFLLDGNRFAHQDTWYTGPNYDVHGICLGRVTAKGQSLWITSTACDAVVRLEFEYWPFATIAETHSAREDLHFQGCIAKYCISTSPVLHDRYHVNSVSEIDGALWYMSHRGVITKRGSHSLFIPRAKAGHSLTVLPGERLAFLDTKEEHFILCDSLGRVLMTADCGAERVEPKVNPNTGKVAKGGWLRGLEILDDTYAVCGTSPAQLFVVNYRTGVVEDHWQLTHDVRESTFEVVRV